MAAGALQELVRTACTDQTPLAVEELDRRRREGCAVQLVRERERTRRPIMNRYCGRERSIFPICGHPRLYLNPVASVVMAGTFSETVQRVALPISQCH